MEVFIANLSMTGTCLDFLVVRLTEPDVQLCRYTRQQEELNAKHEIDARRDKISQLRRLSSILCREGILCYLLFISDCMMKQY